MACFWARWRSRRWESVDFLLWRVNAIRMGNKNRGSRRNPKFLKCRDCGFSPELKGVGRRCIKCGGFMRVRRDKN